MADAVRKRSKHDPKARADRMDRKAGQAAARALPSAFAGLFASVLTAPFGIAPNYKGTRMMDRFDRINANARGAGQIRGAFGMMDTENAVQKETDTYNPRKTPRAGAKLGAAKTEAAIVNRNIGAATTAGGAMFMFAGGANVAAGNFGLGLTGVRGPQSEPRSDHAKAYLNSAAKAKAAKPGPPQMAPARASGPAGQSGARGPTSYTTLDGRTVQGTAGQIAAWKSRRK